MSCTEWTHLPTYLPTQVGADGMGYLMQYRRQCFPCSGPTPYRCVRESPPPRHTEGSSRQSAEPLREESVSRTNFSIASERPSIITTVHTLPVHCYPRRNAREARVVAHKFTSTIDSNIQLRNTLAARVLSTIFVAIRASIPIPTGRNTWIRCSSCSGFALRNACWYVHPIPAWPKGQHNGG